MDITIDSLYSETSSVTGDEYTEFIDELTQSHADFTPGVTKYVCHTSTIPLATTVDLLSHRRENQNSFHKEYHGASHRYDTKCTCAPAFCMFINSQNKPTENYLRENCPCLGQLTEGKQLTPLCFMTFIKSMSHNLITTDKTIEPSSVMFCLDSESIFDNKYSSKLQSRIGATGFGHIKPNHVHAMLNETYWYRTNKKRLGLDKLVRDKIEGSFFPTFIAALKQTLHTLNNLIVKKFHCFGPEIVNYAELSMQSADLFKDLLLEYLVDSPADLPEGVYPPYKEAKEFFDFVKQTHDHILRDKRMGITYYGFRNRSLARFFGKELARLRKYIERKYVNEANDYTTSLAWDLRATTLCQSRTLGYLPRYLTREKARDFRNNTTGPVRDVTPDELRIIDECLIDELKLSGIEEGLLINEQTNYREIIKESVSLELKYAASATQTVSNGGKPEDARIYLALIRENGWRIPIRDLETFEIVGYTPLLGEGVMDDIGGVDISSILFWFSLQITLNFSIRRRITADTTPYHAFLTKNGREFHEDKLLECVLIIINESGKARLLVKSMSVLNWMLVPASKISQKILARIPEHKAGLEMGSHDWHHNKRISGESPEANFMYHKDSGKIHSSINMGYMDWTEATDKIKKRVGIQHLNSFWTHVGFPKAYGALIMSVIREPQQVREFVSIEDIDGNRAVLDWSGSINEGFMMGNQMTKTILHSLHLSQRNLVEKYLNKFNVTVERHDGKTKTVKRAVERLSRSAENSRPSAC